MKPSIVEGNPQQKPQNRPTDMFLLFSHILLISLMKPSIVEGNSQQKPPKSASRHK
ncbi:hypothetical protein Hanom_Chr12g01182121 [Helianthus anomalus]